MFGLIKYLSFVFIIWILSLTSLSAKTYTRDFTYHASDNDSKFTSRTIAIDQIKTLLLQEIGTHIVHRISIHKTNDGTMYSSDDVEAVTAGFVSLKILEEKWDGQIYYMRAELEADSSNIIQSINDLAKNDPYLLEQLLEERKKKNKALFEVKRVKKILAEVESDLDKALYEKEYKDRIKDLEKSEEFITAWRLAQEKEYSKAVKLYKKLAEDGHALAQNNLGTIYEGGLVTTRDTSKAKYWYRKAAEQDLAIAQVNLGGLYYYGEGVTKNYKEALYWFSKAAKQNDSMGQITLASLYYFGHGVDKDMQEVFYWIRKAAENGSGMAQHKLATMYEDGLGVQRNYRKAQEWYRKANKQGISSTSDVKNEIKNYQN